jgi:hypothetical protein
MANDRIETEAYKASSEIGKKIYGEDSYFYKPWQFADYKVNPCTLKTTYEEILIWSRQQAMFRPGFEASNGTVNLPNIFAKINGVHKSIRMYRKEIKRLRKEPNTLFFTAFPLYRLKQSGNTSRTFYDILDNTSYIDKRKLMLSQAWRYRHLRTSLQSEIADRIIDFCSLARFKNYEVWSKEENKSLINKGLINNITDFLQNFDITINLNDSKKSFDSARMRVFNILVSLEDPLIKLISKYDYPFEVPKIVVYNNGSPRSRFTFEDAVKLMFMSSFGIDVIIFNPAGYNDIEDFLRERYYDTHRLEEVDFNLNYSSWTLF